MSSCPGRNHLLGLVYDLLGAVCWWSKVSEPSLNRDWLLCVSLAPSGHQMTLNSLLWRLHILIFIIGIDAESPSWESAQSAKMSTVCAYSEAGNYHSASASLAKKNRLHFIRSIGSLGGLATVAPWRLECKIPPSLPRPQKRYFLRRQGTMGRQRTTACIPHR